MFRHIALGSVAAFSITVSILDKPANALCLTSQAGNNCTTFNPATTSNALQTYTSLNQKNNYHFQIGFRSSNGASYSISNVRYSTDNTNFTTYGSGTFNTGSAFARGSIINATITDPFYIAYDIPTGIPAGVFIDSAFTSNSNGLTDGSGNLISGAGNDFADIERSSQSTPVPAPLPIIGAAAAFSQVRRLRSMSRELH